MGSDLKKPDATTEITRENYRDILWPLPVGALLYAGKRTGEQLRMQGIHTVGDLARTDRQALAALLGRGGDALWLAANGLEDAPVVPPEEQPAVKSVGNGRTFPRDLVTHDEVRRALITLSDEVATRLREAHMMCRTVQVSIKDPKLKVIAADAGGTPHVAAPQISDTALKVMAANWREGAHPRADRHRRKLNPRRPGHRANQPV